MSAIPTRATDYYLSRSGKDANVGTTSKTSWKTLERANKQTFKAGDRLLIQGGEVFPGTLRLDTKDGGTTEKPVVIGSFEIGKAIIEAGHGTALDVDSASGITVENLIVRGNGYPSNQGNGIIFRNSRETTSSQAIRLRDVEAFGFAGRGNDGNGILISGRWNDVQLENCQTHGNRYNGIMVNGARNLKILRSRAWENSGDPEFKENWSGSGIFVTESEDVLIDHCEAWRNGYLCPSDAGGPVGIWAASSSKVLIQYCHSHDNATNGPHDGGGFDFDGGMKDSVMQFNYSHDNEGPGYLIYEWGAGGLQNIVARHNVSANDGAKNGYAGFFIGTDGTDQTINGCRIENNTVIARPQGKTTPTALRMYGNLRAIELSNNLFIAQGVPIISATLKPDMVRLTSNQYIALEGLMISWNGTTYTTLKQWQKATGQETTGQTSAPHK